MHLVEQHIRTKNHPDYAALDNLAFRSKNLYNATLYTVRQEYILNKRYLNNHDIRRIFVEQNNPDFRALPAKCSWFVITQVHQSFLSFFALLKLKAKGEYDKPVRIPRYIKDKTGGRNLLKFPVQAFQKIANGYQLGRNGIIIHSKRTNVKEIRIVPKLSQQAYSIEVVYEVPDTVASEDNNRYAAIDLGVKNLFSVAFNTGDRPILINGKPLININQFHQKTKAKLQSTLASGKELSEEQTEKLTSNRIKRINRKRSHKVKDYLHKVSRYLTNQLVSRGITKIFVGYNTNWKQEVNIGKQNNQAFTLIPHREAVDMLIYKCKLVGIEVIEITEEYTSKCSFVDLEEIGKHEAYLGTRKGRLFTAANGKTYNADICGAGNILRKATSKLKLGSIGSKQEAEAIAVLPVRITPGKESFKRCNKRLQTV